MINHQHMRIIRFITMFLLLLFTAGGMHAQTRATTPIPDSATRPFGFHCAIDSMLTGESMYVEWVLSGCFAFYNDSIWIGKTYTGFTVMHGTHKKTLTNTEADVLRDFEFELYKINSRFGGCTTSEFYTFRRKNVQYLACRDGTCAHDAWTDLLSKLGI